MRSDPPAKRQNLEAEDARTAASQRHRLCACSTNQGSALDEKKGQRNNFYMYQVSSRIDFGKDVIFCRYPIH